MSNLKVNKLIPYTTSNIIVGGDLLISGSLVVTGTTEIIYTNSLGNVFTNPKTIDKNIILTGETNSVIFGPEITIDEGFELYVGEDADLTIFDSDDYINSGDTTIINNNIVSSTTITTIFTGNTSNDPISNLWASGNVRANTFYGDASNLINLPINISNTKGNYSLSQKGEIETLGFGNNSVSFGYLNTSNGNLSTTFGGNNISGSKQYDITSIINGKYILFLEDVTSDFIAGNTVSTTTGSTLFTGSTTTSSSTITYESEIIGSSITGCTNYIIANNTANVITFYYTDCETGLSAQTQVDVYYTRSICSLTEPTYTPYSWMTGYTYPVVITAIGTCCDGIEVTTATTVTEITTIVTSAVTEPYFSNCKTYKLINNTYPYTQDVFYTSCTGNYEFLFLEDSATTVCAIFTPTRYNNLPLGTAVTVTQISSECCISYNVYNRAWCPITVFYTDCYTGLSGSTSISGYLSKTICSLTEPTFDTSCWSSLGYNPNIYSPVVTQNSNNNSCQIQTSQVIYSSLTSVTTYEITSACTEENTYFTGLTGCTNYIIRGETPLLSYTDCFGSYHSLTIITGETYSICSSTYPVVPPPDIPYVEILPTGKCETLCVKYRFTKTYDTTIPAIWDVSYVDCDYNQQYVKLKRAGDSIEVCIILGSELCGTNVYKFQLGSCLQPRTQKIISKEQTGGEITISGLTQYNGYLYDGSATRPINITNIYTGITSGETFTGITGVTVILSGLTGSSNYTILELSDELDINVSSGKIVSNYFGLGSFASGLVTQAKGMASVSQNMFTIANGDYSHAEGYGTQSIGIGSHSEGLDTIVYGDYSHVEGYNNKVYGNYGSSKGVGNITGGKFYKSTFNGSNTITLDSSYGDLTSTFPIAIYPTVTLKNGGYVVLNGSTFNGTNTVLTIDLMSIYTVIGSCINVGEILISRTDQYYDGDQIIGTGSTSEGLGNKNFGNYSHVQGKYNFIFGDNSSAEGSNNTVFGCNSHASGGQNKVYGTNSYVGGVGNIAFGDNQYVIGTYNIENNNTSLFVVGNGLNDTSRTDILRVDADKVKIYEVLNIANINEYADNATALSNGLVTGDVYRTGEYLKIVY